MKVSVSHKCFVIMDVPQIKKLENTLKEIIKNNNLDYKISFLTEPGENYGSIMLKIDVEFTKKDKKQILYFVAKLCPNNQVIRKAFLTDITFKKEVYAYLHSTKSITEFQMKYNIQTNFFTKCYEARLNLSNNNDIDEDALILLENLKIKGYQIADRMIGFSLNQAHIILQNLAQLHATVIAMKILEPESFKNILPAMKPVNVGSIMVDGFGSNALQYIKSMKELQPYIEKIESIVARGKAIGGLKFPFESNENFYTMIHTDLWTNNIMFCENEDNLTVKFIDLQLLEYGSAVRDLLFFLYTSIEVQVLDKYLIYLMNLYYYNFTKCLSTFHVDFINDLMFSWDSFYAELNSVAPHELFHIIFMLKPIFSEKGSIKNLEEISKEDFGRTDNIGETYINRLKFTVLSFAKNNWL